MTSPLESMPVSYVDAATGTNHVDALLSGAKWGGEMGSGAVVSFSFASLASTWYAGAGGAYSDYNEPSAWPALYAGGLDADARAAARAALAAWSDVSGLTWYETAETSSNIGDVRFGLTEVPAIAGFWGWAYLPSAGEPTGGDIWINPEALDGDWSAGSRGLFALIHEAGHAIGLKHPHSGGEVLPAQEDSRQFSVMSYNRHPHSYLGTDGDGRDLYVEPSTPMLYDIAAIQRLYGANLAHATGNDVYSFDPQAKFIRTIWDAGGVDTISAARFSVGCRIDLKQGAFSSLRYAGSTPEFGPGGTVGYDGTDNLCIAFGTSIEKAIGGAGHDRLLGNALNNVLSGGRGNDSIDGGAGRDWASYASAGASVRVDLSITGAQATGGAGTDSLMRIEHLAGSRFNDRLTGNAGANALNGRAGADTMAGGAGNDSYWVDNAGDLVLESALNGAAGRADLVLSTLAAYVMPAGVECLRILASGAAITAGNALNNIIHAGNGDDWINAGEGIDTLSYQYAKGTVSVGLGIDAAQATGGSKIDRVWGFENLAGSNFGDKLRGDAGANQINGRAGADSLSGFAGADRLVGGAGNDRLMGGEGNDLLRGGLGADSLQGGAGSDVFDFDSLAEMAPSGRAMDLIADFTARADKIDLASLDANALAAGNQAFTLLAQGASAFTAPGQLRFDAGLLYGNTDADAAPEFAIALTGVSALADQDFIF